ncbi:hypothetical protein ACFP1Z_16680 [Streptomyces gamaensis]|uniref:L,D-transpeptidase n=1 Tax=Streptomyces gamaensis TaxID=1763542 RepID=A0ABW0Z403_9ACTN
MARSSSGAFVAGLTVAALAGVGFLAYQASAAPDRPARAAHAAPSASDAPDAGKDTPRADPNALPADSGTGMRVVYALERRRVWLVTANGDVTRTFEVAPSTVNPPVGSYKVTSRTPSGPGSDGIPIEHIVRFHRDAAGVVFGFSAAVDGSSPNPTAAKKTGGIREKPADGRAMWEFAINGTPVVVVP